MKRPLQLKNSFPLRASELRGFITGRAVNISTQCSHALLFILVTYLNVLVCMVVPRGGPDLLIKEEHPFFPQQFYILLINQLVTTVCCLMCFINCCVPLVRFGPLFLSRGICVRVMGYGMANKKKETNAAKIPSFNHPEKPH